MFHTFFLSGINGDVMATFRLVFRVSKAQQYSDNFVQDLLRVGLGTALQKKPIEVPQFGQISAIILLGTESTLWREKGHSSQQYYIML